ncbi:MAG TPA: hypothetical protein VF516_42355 [Kofleriaceae bacterium]
MVTSGEDELVQGAAGRPFEARTLVGRWRQSAPSSGGGAQAGEDLEPLEAWPELDAVGARYYGAVQGRRLWDMPNNLHFVLANLGVPNDVRDRSDHLRVCPRRDG